MGLAVHIMYIKEGPVTKNLIALRDVYSSHKAPCWSVLFILIIKFAFTVFLLLTYTRPYRDPGRVGIPPFRNQVEVIYMAENELILQKFY